jgi:hypothetical protein
MGVAIFRKQPDSQQVTAFLAKTTCQAGTPPKYIICDTGSQFWCKRFKRWCKPRKIRSRFGGVGQYGSIAVIERFFGTLKDEGFRRIFVPLNLRKMRAEANAVIAWYNTCRPHTRLGGRTPDERYRRIPAACRQARFEPRPHWPGSSQWASPPAKVRGEPGDGLKLVVDFRQGRKHLPIITPRRMA